MTMFEEFAKEMNVEITTGNDGHYTGMAKALATMTTEVILSDDDEVYNKDWSEQKEIIKEKFYKTFPYMKDDYKITDEVIAEVSRPKSTWEYQYTDTTSYNVDMDIYMTEDGKLVAIDSDWMFN